MVLHVVIMIRINYIIGLFQLGPSPLKAVKEGNVGMKYDVRFVFAEVNADMVYWRREKAGEPFKPFRIDRKAIGRFVLCNRISLHYIAAYLLWCVRENFLPFTLQQFQEVNILILGL